MRKASLALVTLVFLTLSFAWGNTPLIHDDGTPIAPQLPKADRNDASRVFLEQAQTLRSTPGSEYQIVSGDVQFRRDGMFMWCDSAHFYDATGSFDAFGNVRMEQGDTLFIYGDTLRYDEPLKLATLIATDGKQVRLINRDVTLTTDIFRYDIGLDLGYYETGGELHDRQNRLTSLEGEYSPTTKEAVFRDNVILTSRSKDDTLRIFSDNLYYNTLTHIALLTAPSTVVNRDGTIVTSNGVYNTESTESELYDRSTVTYRNGNTLTADTLFYCRQTGIGEGFGNVEINDTTNKVILSGNYGYAFEPSDSAYVTGSAHAIEYSSADSLHLHGDTIRAFRRIIRRMEMVSIPDSACQDTIPADTIFTDSIAKESLTADSIAATAILTDSIAGDEAEMPQMNQLMVERTDTIRFITAFPRVKFYRKDIQGLCDSMTVVSTDTMLYMDRFPILWSDNRQITGERIKIKFNDSTAENATILRNAMMIERIEDGIFNQLAGKEMFALLDSGSLRHLDVNGNVLAITFPAESDSTINKMMSVESSFLAADFSRNELQRLKLWSETSALVTPMYLSKKSQLFLRDFRWLEKFRPQSPADIMVFPDELLEAFSTASTYIEETQPWKTKNSPAPSSDSSTIPPAISGLSTPSPTSLPETDSDDSISQTDGNSNLPEDTSSKKTLPQSLPSSSEIQEPTQDIG